MGSREKFRRQIELAMWRGFRVHVVDVSDNIAAGLWASEAVGRVDSGWSARSIRGTLLVRRMETYHEPFRTNPALWPARRDGGGLGRAADRTGRDRVGGAGERQSG